MIWNLGYRFAPCARGFGYATEASLAAVEGARTLRPELPVTANMVERNVASARAAAKVGLKVVERGPDRNNPEMNAIRVVYSNRALTDLQRAAVFLVD